MANGRWQMVEDRGRLADGGWRMVAGKAKWQVADGTAQLVRWLAAGARLGEADDCQNAQSSNRRNFRGLEPIHWPREWPRPR